MTTTISIVNTHHHTLLKFFFNLVMRTFMIYCLNNLQICNTVTMQQYSHHAVHYIPMTYLLCSWKFIPFDPLHPFCPLLPTASGNH